RLEQCLWNAGAVHRNEGRVGAKAQGANRSRHELFADSAFAGDEDLAVGASDLLDFLFQLEHGWAVAQKIDFSILSHRRYLIKELAKLTTPLRRCRRAHSARWPPTKRSSLTNAICLRRHDLAIEIPESLDALNFSGRFESVTKVSEWDDFCPSDGREKGYRRAATSDDGGMSQASGHCRAEPGRPRRASSRIACASGFGSWRIFPRSSCHARSRSTTTGAGPSIVSASRTT